jgi:hypothetical protein
VWDGAPRSVLGKTAQLERRVRFLW